MYRVACIDTFVLQKKPHTHKNVPYVSRMFYCDAQQDGSGNVGSMFYYNIFDMFQYKHTFL